MSEVISLTILNSATPMKANTIVYSAPSADSLEIHMGYTILESSPLTLPDTVWADEIEIP